MSEAEIKQLLLQLARVGIHFLTLINSSRFERAQRKAIFSLDNIKHFGFFFEDNLYTLWCLIEGGLE